MGAGLRELDPGASEALAKMQGQPLMPALLVDLFLKVSERLREGRTGIVLRAYRDNDGAGFQLTFDVLPGKLKWPSIITAWYFSERVQVRAQNLYNTSGSGQQARDYSRPGFHEPDRDSLVQAMQKALAAPPLEPVLISVKLIREE
jgi:hypothetical protein